MSKHKTSQATVSVFTPPDGGAAMEKEILDEADAKGHKAAAKAQRESDAALAALREQQGRDRAARMEAARRGAAEKTRAMEAATRHELRKLWLRRREESLRSVLDQALRVVEEAPELERRRSIEDLAAEALRELGPGAAVLRVRPADQALLSVAALAACGGAPGGRADGELRVEADPDLPPGVMAVSADGRRRCDNTYAARLRRMESGLRRAAARALGLERDENPADGKETLA